MSMYRFAVIPVNGIVFEKTGVYPILRADPSLDIQNIIYFGKERFLKL